MILWIKKLLKPYTPELAGGGITTVGIAILFQVNAPAIVLAMLCLVSLGWWGLCRHYVRRGLLREKDLQLAMQQGIHELSLETESVLNKLGQETVVQLENLTHETKQVRGLIDDAIDQLIESFTGLENIARNQGSLIFDLAGSESAGNSGREVTFDQFVNGVKDVLGELVANSVKNGETAGTLAQQMSQTSAGFNDVAKMLREITKIADQTNLLAINASIEAARAGSQGKGFAVVASEVRQLSVRSNNFSEEIAEAVDDIAQAISEIEQAVQRMATTELTLVHESRRQSDELLQKSYTFNQRVEASVHQISALAGQSSQKVAAAVKSLQFHDMVSQIIGHVEKRAQVLQSMLSNLGQVSLQGRPDLGLAHNLSGQHYLQSLKNGLGEVSELIETVRHNPVSQKSMDEGEIELF